MLCCTFAVRKPSRFTAAVTDEEEYTPKYPSVRDLFGEEEYVYIMDAKTNGNIGRYLNVSMFLIKFIAYSVPVRTIRLQTNCNHVLYQ